METVYIMMAILAFVVPTVCIFGDNPHWPRKQ